MPLGARAQHLTTQDVHLGLNTMAPGPAGLGMFFLLRRRQIISTVQCDETLNCSKSRLYVQEEECFVKYFSQAIKTIVVY